ncbi:hypothetical protein Csa_021555 [Cucumis sativus]|uniref:Uncharacterized protein n=1 Tax=Cucumis sativus TaxID=3659 RepID=A0A0A0L1F0_CUCSA|nr:hypothetical protein Csa_021555 [Cucumis sativus]
MEMEFGRCFPDDEVLIFSRKALCRRRIFSLSIIYTRKASLQRTPMSICAPFGGV